MQKEEMNAFCCQKWDALSLFILRRATEFSIVDWAIFKTCLITFGLMIGAWFARLFKKLAPLLVLVFIISWLYMVWRVFLEEDFD
ncbi:MAG: hypothetical protein ACK5L0_03950 [Candidatus Fimivivens sp.]